MIHTGVLDPFKPVPFAITLFFKHIIKAGTKKKKKSSSLQKIELTKYKVSPLSRFAPIIRVTVGMDASLHACNGKQK